VKTNVICERKRNVIATVTDDIYRARIVDEWEFEKLRRVRRGQRRLSLQPKDVDRPVLHPGRELAGQPEVAGTTTGVVSSLRGAAHGNG
jgi:hypothetical protein